MAKPIVYGPAYSTFARTCRLALEEKGADYDLVEVDMLSGAHQTPEHLGRHPFGKVPTFAHGDLDLYETDAIIRYVDDAFPGADLVPADAASRARMSQAISVIENYGYSPLIARIFIQRAVMPMTGGTADEAAIEAAKPEAEKAIAALEAIIGDNTYIAGDSLSLADLMLVPIYHYLAMIPEGQALLAKAPNLQRWWNTVSSRASVEKTKPALG